MCQRFGVGEVKNTDELIENTTPEIDVERKVVELEEELKEEVIVDEPENFVEEKIDE